MKATGGRDLGSSSSRRLRTRGQVPAVLYGSGAGPSNLALDAHEFEAALGYRVAVGTLMDLEVDGKLYTVKLQEIQRHPVKRTLSHLDFLAIDVREEIEATVELRLLGEELELVEAGVSVRGHVKDIPGHLDVPGDLLEKDQEEIVAGMLSLPKGVQLVSDPGVVVARLLKQS